MGYHGDRSKYSSPGGDRLSGGSYGQRGHQRGDSTDSYDSIGRGERRDLGGSGRTEQAAVVKSPVSSPDYDDSDAPLSSPDDGSKFLSWDNVV